MGPRVGVAGHRGPATGALCWPGGTGMFQTICDGIPWDADTSLRTRRLELMRRVLDGTLYDVVAVRVP